MCATCQASKKDQTKCELPAQPGSDWCHMHNPEGKYRLQHPGKTPPKKWTPNG